MENIPIRSVLIVGGGTAGWLTACILAKQLNAREPNGVSVTLLESPNIPTIGVGEGTWPTIRQTLHSIGVDESEFIRQCDASFKQGTEFVNWVQAPQNGLSQRYYHPQGAVLRDAYDFNLAAYWLAGYAPDHLAYDHAVTLQAAICDHDLAPKKITTPAYGAIQNYSYHLNAGKFAAFLTQHGTENLGIRHVRANVLTVALHADGRIASVQTDSTEHATIKSDFFVDCSGSRALLLGQALNIAWRPMNRFLFNDRALAMQVPYEEVDSAIKSHTIATAHQTGWTWDIGLSTRRGVGFVYSSSHCSDSLAESQLRQYVGKSAHELDIKKISFDVGFREKFWHKNCVAIGMSAAFVEPLEASAIFMIEASANMLAEQFPRQLDAITSASRSYNQLLTTRWLKTVDFIKLHYCLSQRQDHAYWTDNVVSSSVPDSLKERLEHWRYYIPGKFDFDFAYEPFVLDSYLFVLFGMGYKPLVLPDPATLPHKERARKHFSMMQSAAANLVAELPTNRELVKKVFNFGFNKI